MTHRLLGPLAGLALASLLPATGLHAAARFCARTDVRTNRSDAHSVVVADLYPGNGPDLAISFGAPGRLTLWQNDGTGTFTERDVLARPADDSTITSQVSDPRAIVAADFNDDGLVDLAGTNRQQARYFAYPNPGVPGGWGTWSVPDARRGDGNAMTAVDLNGDGALDLVVGQDSGAVSIALGGLTAGRPNGTWGSMQRFSTTAVVGVFTDVEVANFYDVAGEGTFDVLAVDTQYGQLVIWPGDPLRPGYVDTTASALRLVPVTDGGGLPLSPVDAILGNWNGDLFPDVLVSTTQGVMLFFAGNGLPSVFDAPQRQDFVASLGLGARMPSDWASVQYAEMTGDGIRDLVVADAGETASDRGFNWLTVIPGLTDAPSAPTFDVADQRHHAMGNLASLRPQSVAVADLDGDGTRDVVVLHGDGATMTILRNDGTGALDAPRSYSAGGTQPRSGAAGQLDADAPDEIVISLASPADASNRGPAIVQPAGGLELGLPVRLPSSGLDQPTIAVVASINTAEDSTNDVLVTHASSQALWEGNGTGGFAAPLAVGGPGRVEVADVLGTASPDLVTVERSPENRVRIYEGDGRGAFTLRATFSSIYGGRDAAAGSFFGSTGKDVVVSGTDLGGMEPGLYVIRWNDTTSSHDAPVFVPLSTLSLPPTELVLLETADLDGAGAPEIVALASGGEAYVFTAVAGSFQADPAGILFGGAPQAVVVRDLTGDGILDIAVADRTSVRVREGQGGTSFGPLLTLASNITNDGLVAADLDADGLPELVAVSTRTADLTVFCNTSVGAMILRVGRPMPADELSWTSQGAGATYSIASGTINSFFATGSLSDATCLATPVGASYDDVRPLPAPAAPTFRSGWYYLLKCSGGDCAEPTFGMTSLGEPRFGPGAPGAVPDPCP